MMKRRFQAVMVLALFSFSCVLAQKVTIDKITYLIEKGEACVYEADEDIEVANILSSVEYKGKSYPVTRIGKQSTFGVKGHAFYKRNLLAYVSIPNSVKAIESAAFYECESLEEISIPNSIKSFGEWCFMGTPLKKNNSSRFASKYI